MIERSITIALRNRRASKGHLCAAAMLLFVAVVLGWSPVQAGSGGETKSAGGLTVYLGVVAAEIFKGPESYWVEPPMHGGSPNGPHEHHIVVAIYDTASNTRITDATVTAKVSGLGLSGPEKTLEPMKTGDVTTYGAFFNLTDDLYTIRVTVRRSGAQPVVLDFNFDHRGP